MQIPEDVRTVAKSGLKLLAQGAKGGTLTGWNRAKQLAYDSYISVNDLAVMRAWFARHGPDAINGGTSYPGYCKWIQTPSNAPTRGAVAWLIWGGNPAYLWLKSAEIRNVIEKEYPNRKKASNVNML
jgi:hypothetical protein